MALSLKKIYISLFYIFIKAILLPGINTLGFTRIIIRFKPEFRGGKGRKLFSNKKPII